MFRPTPAATPQYRSGSASMVAAKVTSAMTPSLRDTENRRRRPATSLAFSTGTMMMAASMAISR